MRASHRTAICAASMNAHFSVRDSWRRMAPTPEREAEVNWRLAADKSSGLPGEGGIHQFDGLNARLTTDDLASGAAFTLAARTDAGGTLTMDGRLGVARTESGQLPAATF